MSRRKDSYRAALQRGHGTAKPRPAAVIPLHSRYVRVTVEVAPALRDDLTRWLGPAVSTQVFAGATVVRGLVARLATLVNDPRGDRWSAACGDDLDG